jgi:ribosomal-protein-alanine N-acetyltransferase
MKPFAAIETERLLIRPLRLEDWPEVYSRASDPEVVRFTGEVLSREEAKRLLQKRIDEQFAKAPLGGRAIVLKESGLNIGYCGLDHLPHSTEQQIELFYGLTRRFWGHGFATEAAAAMLKHGFCDLNLKGIVSAVHPDNLRSIKVAENVGLIYRKKIDWPAQGKVNLYGLSIEEYIRNGEF